MSATKSMQKWCKTATDQELVTAKSILEQQRTTERNAMKRSSLTAQITIIGQEQAKRTKATAE
jgi:hypothetical protein